MAEGARVCESCGAGPATTERRSSPGLKILLVVVIVLGAAFVVGAIGLAFGVWTFTRQVAVNPSNGQLQITTPGGQITVGEKIPVTEADLGVPIYPGSEQAEGGVQVKTPQGVSGTYVFRTADPPNKVMAFYREKLAGREASFIESSDRGMITGGTDRESGFLIAVTREEKDGKTVIAITRGRAIPAEQ
jgi:hypothetical protein